MNMNQYTSRKLLLFLLELHDVPAMLVDAICIAVGAIVRAC